jgi:hypothetical protein
MKPVFELYTPKVKERMEAKRKEENWDSKHRLLVAGANRKLTKEQNANKATTDALLPTDKLEKEETDAQLEVLSA